MNLLRNPEIKRNITVLLLVMALATAGGAFIGFLCAVYVFAACVIVSIVSLSFTRQRYNRLAQLSERIDCLLYGDGKVDFSSFREGELAVLGSEIDKMAVRLREQASALEQDKQFLQNFLADVSHQLRTPLTSLQLIVARLREDDMDADERARLAMGIDSILSRVGWLVDSLLKISRLESGTVVFEQKPVFAADLIKKSVEPFEILMEIREIKLVIHLENNAVFTGDFSWSAEALGNILKNCIEHTPAGGHIQLVAEENPLFTEIVVSDTGGGIHPKDLPHIFERFYQGRDASGNHFGIGLALAQMIIHGQNGTLKAENNRGRGARFTIRFYPAIR